MVTFDNLFYPYFLFLMCQPESLGLPTDRADIILPTAHTTKNFALRVSLLTLKNFFELHSSAFNVYVSAV